MTSQNERFSKAVPELKRDSSDNQENIRLTTSFVDLSLTSQTLDQNHRDETVLIVGLGPSLNEENEAGETYLEQLENDKDGVKVLAAAAHRLLNQGKLSTADAAVFSLSSTSPNWVEKVPTNMEYHLASICPPELYEKIEEGNGTIKKFHALGEGKYPENEIAIGAGTTGAVTSLALYMAMGHKKFEFYGVDGALNGVPAHEYAIPIDDVATEKDLESSPAGEIIKVKVDNQIFDVERGFYHQALELLEFINTYGQDCEFKFHGDSLNYACIEAGIKPEVIYDKRNGINIDPNDLGQLDPLS